MDISEIVTGFPLDRVIAFDTETTGLSPERDELLSVAVVDGNGRQLFSSLVRPSRKKSWAEAQRVNHISPQMVRDAPRIAEVRDELRGYFTGEYLAVSYNGGFDVRFLHAAGILENPWLESDFDVMREFARVHGSRRWESGGYKYSKLAECARYYGYSFDAHDAAEDARATAHCFRSLLCDRKYLEFSYGSVVDSFRSPSTSQTKATIQAIEDILDGSHRAKRAGRLSMGEITRGKNKGEPRYDVVVGDVVVGHLSASGMRAARGFAGVADAASLPEGMDCQVTLSDTGGRATCSVALTGDAPAMSMALAQAVRDRPGTPSTSGQSPRHAKGSAAHEANGELNNAVPTSTEEPKPRKRWPRVLGAILLGILALDFLIIIPTYLAAGQLGAALIAVALCVLSGWGTVRLAGVHVGKR